VIPPDLHSGGEASPSRTYPSPACGRVGRKRPRVVTQTPSTFSRGCAPDILVRCERLPINQVGRHSFSSPVYPFVPPSWIYRCQDPVCASPTQRRESSHATHFSPVILTFERCSDFDHRQRAKTCVFVVFFLSSAFVMVKFECGIPIKPFERRSSFDVTD